MQISKYGNKVSSVEHMLFLGWLINQPVSNEERTTEWKQIQWFWSFFHLLFIIWILMMPFKPLGIHECVRVFLLHRKFNDINSFIYIFIHKKWIGYRMDCFSIVKIWFAFVSMLPTTDKFANRKSIHIYFYFRKPKVGPCDHIHSVELDFNWFTTRKINIETKYTHASNLENQFEQIQSTTQLNKRIHAYTLFSVFFLLLHRTFK